MINLSWLIFPKVSRVVPAGGRGKDTGRRRRTRRKRGNTRRKRRRDAGGGMGRRGGGGGEKEPEERKKRKLWVFGSHQPGQKKFGHYLELRALTLFFFFFNQVICCLSFHRSERIQIIKGPYAWGQGRQPSSTFNLKFRRNLLRVSNRGY